MEVVTLWVFFSSNFLFDWASFGSRKRFIGGVKCISLVLLIIASLRENFLEIEKLENENANLNLDFNVGFGVFLKNWKNSNSWFRVYSFLIFNGFLNHELLFYCRLYFSNKYLIFIVILTILPLISNLINMDIVVLLLMNHFHSW